MNATRKSTVLRIVFYISGLLVLALGIILNTKSGLGVSPIISVAYSISTIWHFNFGNTTFALYAVFVLIQLILHTTRNLRQRKTTDKALEPAVHRSLPLILLMDLLQLPLSLIFTRFMNLFSAWIPAPENKLGLQLILLLFAGHLVGVGLGTVLSVLGVGRCIAVFNHFFKNKMNLAAGMEE